MKKGIIKAVVLLCCFFAALLTFGYFTNQNNSNLTTEMKDASYPVVSMYYKDYLVGSLHGYRDAMDLTSMRETLVPVQSDRKVSVSINTFGGSVDQISYEIRSLDGERLIAEHVCVDYETEGDTRKLQLVLENMLEADGEYQLIFLLQQGDETLRYYTRLILTQDEHLDDYLQFANEFHEMSMNKNDKEQLATYLEPDSSLSNDNLNQVTINSSLDEVSWADLDCEQQDDTLLTLEELSDGYAVLTLNYVVRALGDGGEIEYYNASEYYRVSYNSEGSRCYLHDFQRSLNQIFRADGLEFDEEGICLGIRDSEVEYKKSENGQVTCFVQQGELWAYSEENDTLYRIFSFRGYEGLDIRENYDAHRIRILTVSEGGSVDFAVYGYMNRGTHEGECGISICHFDRAAGTVEELLFIKSDKSYQRLWTDMGDVLYENAQGILFCEMEGSIYRIDTADGSMELLAEGLDSEGCKVSKDGYLIAWQSDAETHGDLCVLNLETEVQHRIAADGSLLYPLGFLSDDFVYGVADADGVAVADGSIPMSEVRIYDTDEATTIKSYHKNKYYITDVTIGDYSIDLTRVRLVGGTYRLADSDTIFNHQGEALLDDNVYEAYDETRQTVVELKVTVPEEHNSANVVNFKEVLVEQPLVLTLEVTHPWEGYYVYAKGGEQTFTSSLQAAIEAADEQMGVVVDSSLRSVWKRARQLVCTPLSLPEKLDVDDMEATYPDATAYDLTGCTLTETLYYVSQGIPVVITRENGSRQLIVGYDSANVWIYDPVDGQTTRETISEAGEGLASYATRYTGYLE